MSCSPTGLITCAKCGKHYRRKITRTQAVWVCATYNMFGKEHCASKQIPEITLDALVGEVAKDVSKIEKIIADDNNTVHFHLVDGSVITRIWKDRSRSESWTDEMKEAARQKTLQRYAPKEVE